MFVCWWKESNVLAHKRKNPRVARVWHTNTYSHAALKLNDLHFNFRSDFNLHNVDVGHLWLCACTCVNILNKTTLACVSDVFFAENIIYCVYDVRNDFSTRVSYFSWLLNGLLANFWCFFFVFPNLNFWAMWEGRKFDVDFWDLMEIINE